MRRLGVLSYLLVLAITAAIAAAGSAAAQSGASPSVEYKLLATKKTGTMQKELSDAGAQGFEFVGVTVASTAFAGNEVVCILRRPKR